jgi:two-component system, OmpR family, response regulator RpaA
VTKLLPCNGKHKRGNIPFPRLPLSEADLLSDVFTAGQIARFCAVAPRTVSKWIDTGLLVGYRIPKSQHRRVPRSALVRFLRDNGLPVPAGLDDSGLRKVLLTCGGDLLAGQLAALLPAESCRLARVADLFALGLDVQAEQPSAIILDLGGLGRSDCLRAASVLAGLPFPPALCALTTEDESDPAALLAPAGPFGLLLPPPVDAGALARWLLAGKEVPS